MLGNTENDWIEILKMLADLENLAKLYILKDKEGIGWMNDFCA